MLELWAVKVRVRAKTMAHIDHVLRYSVCYQAVRNELPLKFEFREVLGHHREMYLLQFWQFLTDATTRKANRLTDRQ